MNYDTDISGLVYDVMTVLDNMYVTYKDLYDNKLSLQHLKQI